MYDDEYSNIAFVVHAELLKRNVDGPTLARLTRYVSQGQVDCTSPPLCLSTSLKQATNTDGGEEFVELARTRRRPPAPARFSSSLSWVLLRKIRWLRTVQSIECRFNLASERARFRRGG